MNSGKFQSVRSTHKNQLCFYIQCNEQSQKETKKAIPYIIVSKRRKYVGINLAKQVKDLNTEN